VQEKRAEKDRLMYGTLTEDKEKALEDLKKAYDKLLTAMQVPYPLLGLARMIQHVDARCGK
jgi:hypothetical protein